jgi:YD repeat-containing protein
LGSIDAIWFRLDKTITTQDGVSTAKQYAYNVDQSGLPKLTMPASISEQLSDRGTKRTQLYYPGDADPDNTASVLGPALMWDVTLPNYKSVRSPLIKVKNFTNNNLTSQEVSHYSYDGTNDLILRTGYDVLPTGTDADKKTWTFEYDNKANIISVKKKNDISTSYFWGYNRYQPVIKAENITPNILNAAVQSSTNNIEQLLIDVGDMTTESQRQQWRLFNSQLGSHLPPNTMITTYTFKVLAGITSQTDQNGKAIYYNYDEFGRLKAIKDDQGNILKTYSYYYKQD